MGVCLGKRVNAVEEDGRKFQEGKDERILV